MFGLYTRNSILFYITLRLDTILNKGNEVYNLASYLTIGRGIGESHRLKL